MNARITASSGSSTSLSATTLMEGARSVAAGTTQVHAAAPQRDLAVHVGERLGALLEASVFCYFYSLVKI